MSLESEIHSYFLSKGLPEGSNLDGVVFPLRSDIRMCIYKRNSWYEVTVEDTAVSAFSENLFEGILALLGRISFEYLVVKGLRSEEQEVNQEGSSY